MTQLDVGTASGTIRKQRKSTNFFSTLLFLFRSARAHFGAALLLRAAAWADTAPAAAAIVSPKTFFLPLGFCGSGV